MHPKAYEAVTSRGLGWAPVEGVQGGWGCWRNKSLATHARLIAAIQSSLCITCAAVTQPSHALSTHSAAVASCSSHQHGMYHHPLSNFNHASSLSVHCIDPYQSARPLALPHVRAGYRAPAVRVEAPGGYSFIVVDKGVQGRGTAMMELCLSVTDLTKSIGVWLCV